VSYKGFFYLPECFLSLLLIYKCFFLTFSSLLPSLSSPPAYVPSCLPPLPFLHLLMNFYLSFYLCLSGPLSIAYSDQSAAAHSLPPPSPPPLLPLLPGANVSPSPPPTTHAAVVLYMPLFYPSKIFSFSLHIHRCINKYAIPLASLINKHTVDNGPLMYYAQNKRFPLE
jgi:hypothetical protein